MGYHPSNPFANIWQVWNKTDLRKGIGRVAAEINRQANNFRALGYEPDRVVDEMRAVAEEFCRGVPLVDDRHTGAVQDALLTLADRWEMQHVGGGTGKVKPKRHGAESGPRLKQATRRDLIVAYIDEECSGKWTGSRDELRAALKKDRRLEVSDTTLWRDTKDDARLRDRCKHAGWRGPRAAKGRGEREAANDEQEAADSEPDDAAAVEHAEYYAMPDND